MPGLLLASVLFAVPVFPPPPAHAAAAVAPPPTPGWEREVVEPASASAVLREAPSEHAHVLARASLRTPFGQRTRWVVMQRANGYLGVSDPAGRDRLAWIKDDARVRTDGVSTSRVVVDLRSRRLLAYHRGRLALRAAITVGSSSTPTPTGIFQVTDRLPGAKVGPAYGCCVIALSAVQKHLAPGWPGGDRIAIHAGAVSAQTFSNGCIHVPDAPLRKLLALLRTGDPVRVKD